MKIILALAMAHLILGRLFPNFGFARRKAPLVLYALIWIISAGATAFTVHTIARSVIQTLEIMPPKPVTKGEVSQLQDAIGGLDQRTQWRFLLLPLAGKDTRRTVSLISLALFARDWDRRDYEAWFRCYNAATPADQDYLERWANQTRHAPSPLPKQLIHAPAV